MSQKKKVGNQPFNYGKMSDFNPVFGGIRIARFLVLNFHRRQLMEILIGILSKQTQ
jgi:hypothetical protein